MGGEKDYCFLDFRIMSVTSSVELRGEFNNINNVITLLMSLDLKKKLLFDGELIIGEYNSSEDFVDSTYLPVNFNTEQEVFDFLKGYKNLASLYIGVKIKSSYHYFTFYFSDDKSINFTIDGNRRKIDKRYTDFSWYFTNFINPLINDKFNLDSIIYCDE